MSTSGNTGLWYPIPVKKRKAGNTETMLPTLRQCSHCCSLAFTTNVIKSNWTKTEQLLEQVTERVDKWHQA